MGCNWFEKCGSTDEVYEKLDYIWAKSIKDVDKNIHSVKWEEVCNEERNELHTPLYMRCRESGDWTLLNAWNEQIEITGKQYWPDIVEKVKQAVAQYALPEKVLTNVRYNVRMLFLCEFYSEHCHSEFYDRLLEIYLSGHLPCGYKGRYRKGSIIIY